MGAGFVSRYEGLEVHHTAAFVGAGLHQTRIQTLRRCSMSDTLQG